LPQGASRLVGAGRPPSYSSDRRGQQLPGATGLGHAHDREQPAAVARANQNRYYATFPQVGFLKPVAGAGVIWNGIPFETLVIPAKAGIQSVISAFPMACGVDSRFRGNDCTSERPCLANDTSTRSRVALVVMPCPSFADPCHFLHGGMRAPASRAGHGESPDGTANHFA